MTLYDSSVLIDYLAGESGAVDYVETHLDERAVAPPLVLFEVYQGEVFKAGQPDFEAVNLALSWLTIVDVSADIARSAGELQAVLQRQGEPLAARDAFIAGAALGLDEHLAVADSDFAVEGISDVIDIEFL
jgi:predicted nucleic acid-binding protein